MNRYYRFLKKHGADDKLACRYCGFKRVWYGVYALTEQRHSYRGHALKQEGVQSLVRDFRGSSVRLLQITYYRRYMLAAGFQLLGFHLVCRNCQAIRTRKSSSNRQHGLVRRHGRLACVQCGFACDNPIVFEEHHISGHHAGPTVLLCLNCHAIETERQRQGIINENFFAFSSGPEMKELLLGRAFENAN